jgi:CRISPR-associated protein Csd2
MSLSRKIDFAIIIKVKNANPNGDPLNGNRPRTNYDNQGEITDVCLKRKIRDRLQESGQSIFVQSDEKKTDGMTSLKNRAEADAPIGLGKDAFNAKKTSKDDTAKNACDKWFDVRSFGQVFAFGKTDSADGVSIAIRGPVTIQSAFSVDPIEVASTQITKSVSGEGDGSKKSSDTMGMKHRVEGEAFYVTYGAMSPQLAERTGFSDADADIIKNILPKLFEGDASSARPEGSMKIEKVIWWQHNSKAGQYSSAKVHNSLHVNNDGSYQLTKLDDLIPEEVDGF